MENEKESQFVKKVYRDILRDEINRSAFKREKKEFIASHFSREPFWLMRPVVLVPALSFCLMIALVQWSPLKQALSPSEPLSLPETAAPVVRTVPEEIKTETLASAPADEAAETSDVNVKWARSEVGSVMVYKKQAGEVPITIVWVFTPTEAAGL